MDQTVREHVCGATDFLMERMLFVHERGPPNSQL